MLSPEIQNQLKEHFSKLTSDVKLTLVNGSHSKRRELEDFLAALEELSDRIIIEHVAEHPLFVSAISFHVGSEDRNGVVFSGIPSGHEFSSLILAILQAGGVTPKLSESVLSDIKAIKQELKFQTIVSLECNNCPEVVQTLNSFSLVNPNIQNEMVDGALFQESTQKHNIKSVPAVLLNGEPFAMGKIGPADILEKLFSTLVTDSMADEKSVQVDDVVRDIAVIGGGPAGIAAAIYSARKGLYTTLIADRIGGQVNDTAGIENLISALPTDGPALTKDFRTLLADQEIELLEYLRVEKIEPHADGHKIHLNNGKVIAGRTVIVASGARWRKLNVPGEADNIGKGVAFCPHCDGPFFKDKSIAVVGGGNSGVEAALDLAGIAEHVSLLEFGPQLMADKVLLDRAAGTHNITTITNAETTSIAADENNVTGLNYKDRETDTNHSLTLDGVFVQIGLLPNSEFVAGLLATNSRGEIEVDDSCRTNVPGIFACGDVTTTPYKQIAVAVGEGAKASLAAFDYLLRLPKAPAA